MRGRRYGTIGIYFDDLFRRFSRYSSDSNADCRQGFMANCLCWPLGIMIVWLVLENYHIPAWLDIIGIVLWVIGLIYAAFVIIRGIIRFIRGVIAPVPEIQVMQDLEFDDDRAAYTQWQNICAC